MHLRAFHRRGRCNEDESNRYRDDGGYHYNQRHWYPGDDGFDPRRDVGVNSRARSLSPVANSGSTTRPLQFSTVELGSFLQQYTSTITESVERQVHSVLHSTASMMSIAGMSSEANVSRRFIPVPNTNNVLVSISNPANQALPLGNYYNSF